MKETDIEVLKEAIEHLKNINNLDNALSSYLYECNDCYKNNLMFADNPSFALRFVKNLNYTINNQFRPLFPKNSPLKNHQFKRGEVCNFNFGVNIAPEMSLDHMGIVISESHSFLYVLPICSKTERHKNAYHPIDNNGLHNKDCDKSFYLMKPQEFSFLKHDSVLNLLDLKSISKKRTIKVITKLDINSDFFKYITEYSAKNIFTDNIFFRDLQLHKMNSELIKFLNEELIRREIEVNKGDNIDVLCLLKGNYGYLKNEIVINTSEVGCFDYELILADDFGNEVTKKLRVCVVDEDN